MMKKLMLHLMILWISCHTITAQSTDRFIRIVGTTSHKFIADGIQAEINLFEVPENINKKTEAISIDEVYKQFRKVLEEAGIKDSLVTTPDLNLAKNFSATSRTFHLNLKDPDKMQILVNTPMQGLRVSNIVYTYDAIDPDMEQTLIGQAIEDAKRKVANICAGIGMKTGKILNIEDISSGCCGEIKDSRESRTTKTYNVNVTFELKDR